MLAQCAEVYACILVGTEYHVVAHVMDKDGWFRQILTARTDRWRAVTTLAGGFICDERLIMENGQLHNRATAPPS